MSNHVTSQASAPESADLVDRLFAKLAMMYGKHWLDLWSDIPMAGVKAEWSRALTGISAEQMRLALEAIFDKGNTFPPTLPEFVSLCRQCRKFGQPLRLAAPRERGEIPAHVLDVIAKLRK
jgi:hypothetical protein